MGLLQFVDTPAGIRATAFPRNGYDYRITGGGNDFTVHQQRVATRRIDKRKNCRSLTEAEQTAEGWAKDVIHSEHGPW